VAKAGYLVIEVSDQDYLEEGSSEFRWVRSRRILSDPSSDYEDCLPLENPALFMNLARVECCEDQVLALIARYGTLHTDPKWRELRRRRTEVAEVADEWSDYMAESMLKDDPDFFLRRESESFEAWYTTIRSLRYGIGLWNAARTDSDKAALQTVRTLNLEGVSGLGASLANTVDAADVGDVSTRQEARRAAQQYALERFRGQVVWSFGQALPHNRDVIELTPTDLFTGLWLQFVAALAADSQFGTCEHCGNFYDASTTRKTRKYCGDSCKTRAWNRAHPDHMPKTRKKKGRTDGSL
jgi:hypothetical protein